MTDLSANTFSDGPTNNGDPETETAGEEMKQAGMDTNAAYLAEFFRELDVIHNEIDQFGPLLVKLQNALEENKSITKAQAVKALSDRMNQDVTEVSKTAKSIKEKLEQLDKANASSRKTKGCEEDTSTDQTRVALTNCLRERLKGCMDSFSAFRTKIMGEYKETIERRYFTFTGQKPDEPTLDHIIETGENETLLQKAIQEKGRGQVLDTITNRCLRKMSKDCRTDFSALRSKIMGEYEETIERRHFTVMDQKLDEETPDHIIETGESEALLQKAIQQQGLGQVLDTIGEIQERHDGVKEIEKSLLELHQTFLDMSVFVEEDLHMFANIVPCCVLEATSSKLHPASRHERIPRKWTWTAMILLLILILILKSGSCIG